METNAIGSLAMTEKVKQELEIQKHNKAVS